MFYKSILIILILSALNSCDNQSESPNIIMMIGDGMGISQVSTSMYSNDNYTPLERSEYIGLSKTHAVDDLITDSAASGTALSSGVKTYNGVLGLDKDFNPVKSILEICRDKGYMTAILVTSTIVHATPAAYYSKSKSRYEYDNIAVELSKSNINLFVGGWIVKDAQKFSINKILLAVPLIITYLIGPFGIFIYWIIRIFYAKRINLYE